MSRNRHDVVQHETFVTSKYRSPGGVAWSRSAHFALQDHATNATWNLLANLSQATAPPTVERVKRHMPAPVFERMRSHHDLNDQVEFVRDAKQRKLVKVPVEDRRPPLHPIFDDQSRSRVRIVPPTRSKRQQLEDHVAEMARRKRDADAAAAATRGMKKEGEFGLWGREEDFGSGGNVDPEAEAARRQRREEQAARRRLPLWERMEKDPPPDPKAVHKAPVFNSGPRFRPSSAELEQIERRKRRKQRLRAERRRQQLLARAKRIAAGGAMAGAGGGASTAVTAAHNPFAALYEDGGLGDDDDDLHLTEAEQELLAAMVRAEEETAAQSSRPATALKAAASTRPGSPAAAGDTSGATNTSGITAADSNASGGGKRRILLKRGELSEEDLPRPLVVDFSARPFQRWPCHSFGKPPEGENEAQRKKRTREEADAAEAEYALRAKMEAEERRQKAMAEARLLAPHHQSDDFAAAAAAGHHHHHQLVPRADGSRHTPDFGRGAPRDATPKRREHFLQLFRRADSAKASPAQLSRLRTRTPELPTGVLLSAAGRDGDVVANQLFHADASAKRAERAMRMATTPTPGRAARRTPTPTPSSPGAATSPGLALNASAGSFSSGAGRAASFRKEVTLAAAASPSVVMSAHSM